MFKGKTKRGVDVFRTQGIGGLKKPLTLFLVADRHSAKLFEGKTKNDLRLLQDLSPVTSQMDEYNGDSYDNAAREFAKQVIATVAKQKSSGFERLVFIAEPRFLGMLKKELRDKLKVPLESFEKDFCEVPEHDLKERIFGLIENA